MSEGTEKKRRGSRKKRATECTEESGEQQPNKDDSENPKKDIKNKKKRKHSKSGVVSEQSNSCDIVPQNKKTPVRPKKLSSAEVQSQEQGEAVTEKPVEEVIKPKVNKNNKDKRKKKLSKTAVSKPESVSLDIPSEEVLALPKKGIIQEIKKADSLDVIPISEDESAVVHIEKGIDVVSKPNLNKKGKGKKKKKQSTLTATEQEPVSLSLISEVLSAIPNKVMPVDSTKEVSDLIQVIAKEDEGIHILPKQGDSAQPIPIEDDLIERLSEQDAPLDILPKEDIPIQEKSLLDFLAKEEDSESSEVMDVIETAPSKNKVARKRPTATDFLEEPTYSPTTVTSISSDEEDQPVPARNNRTKDSLGPRKRAKATDFLEEPSTSQSKEHADKTPGVLQQGDKVITNKKDTEEIVPDEEETEEPYVEQPFLGYANFQAYSNVLLPSVVQFLKITKQLPSTKDEYDFYLSYPSFMAFSKNQGQRVLQLIGKIFKHHHVYQAWNTLPSHTVTGVDEQTDAVVEANDTLLERVDKILDMLKQSKNENKLDVQQKSSKDVLVAAWNTSNNTPQSKPIRLLHSKNILRPQLRWAVKPDNSQAPFIPLITAKPNALVPLQDEFQELLSESHDMSGVTKFLKAARGDKNVHYPHPYKWELEQQEAQPWQFELGLKQEPKELEDTPLTIVDQPDQIPLLCAKLAEAREIAVDLEAHSYRSFLGFTCLMQISTRSEDFIVDTLALRTELQPLNKIFTDPAKLKVFHGANNDIKWLQRDLGLYVVNMFDTYHASKQLGLPRCSLSYLLHRYCDVTADKQYQLADWRIRPLPDVMLKYAREDTHFLLYVQDCLRYELLSRGIHAMESVYRNSNTECMERFSKPVYTKDSYLDVYNKVRIALNPQQKQCMKQIFAWRDTTARGEDESTAFVLPNHMMFKIAELLPPDQEGILGCCNPPPPLVRLHVQELHLIVEKARHYNPLLDPANLASQEEEYTPGFMDTTHQYAVESLMTPKATPARRIKERKEIFYIPRTGPDLVIKKKSAAEGGDNVSITSESGTISGSVSSLQFFDVSVLKNDVTEAVRVVKESMAAPFKLFMNKIAQLRDEEEEKKQAEPIVYPIQEVIPKEEEDDDEGGAIIFKSKNKRPVPDDGSQLRATSKKAKKSVGDIKPFDYQEITMTSMAEVEDVKPLLIGDMLNKGEEGRAKSVKQRTNLKSGNRSGFQNFLKSKFKR